MRTFPYDFARSFLQYGMGDNFIDFEMNESDRGADSFLHWIAVFQSANFYDARKPDATEHSCNG